MTHAVSALHILTAVHAHAAIVARRFAGGAQAVVAALAVHMLFKLAVLGAHAADAARVLAVEQAAFRAKTAGITDLFAVFAQVVAAVRTVKVLLKISVLHAHFAGAAFGFTVGEAAFRTEVAVFAQLVAGIAQVVIAVRAGKVIVEVAVLHAHAADTAFRFAVHLAAQGAETAFIAQFVAGFAKIVVALRAVKMFFKFAVFHAHAADAAFGFTVVNAARFAKLTEFADYITRFAQVAVAAGTPEMFLKFALFHTHAADTALTFAVLKAAVDTQAARTAYLFFGAGKTNLALLAVILHAAHAMRAFSAVIAPIIRIKVYMQVADRAVFIGFIRAAFKAELRIGTRER
jgi:hypothetical protein